jgi:hypothetical protein
MTRILVAPHGGLVAIALLVGGSPLGCNFCRSLPPPPGSGCASNFPGSAPGASSGRSLPPPPHILTIPPRQLTVTRMTVLGVRIQSFVARHARMPKSLSELPEEPGKDCEVVDAWGRPFRWSYDEASRKFTIWSLGRDGKSGGTGDDADIFLSDHIIPDYGASPPSPTTSPR